MASHIHLSWHMRRVLVVAICAGSAVVAAWLGSMAPSVATDGRDHPMQAGTPVPTRGPKLARGPQLIAPPSGYFQADALSPEFKWSYGRKLGKSDYFRFTIDHRMGVDVRCVRTLSAFARDYIPLLAFTDNQPFKWSIQVVRVSEPVTEGAACEGTPLTAPSSQFDLYWGQAPTGAAANANNAGNPAGASGAESPAGTGGAAPVNPAPPAAPAPPPPKPTCVPTVKLTC
jgi:hypothetical protein